MYIIIFYTIEGFFWSKLETISAFFKRRHILKTNIITYTANTNIVIIVLIYEKKIDSYLKFTVIVWRITKIQYIQFYN